MKALSVKQPWASLLIFGGKDIENRDWPVKSAKLIGHRHAIHSSKDIDPYDVDDALDLVLSMRRPDLEKIIRESYQQRGCILGTAYLIGCTQEHESPWFFGKYGWVLEKPTALKNPIPCRGALGFWTVPPEIEKQIQQAERRHA